jgi:hypothetical protein
MYRSIIVVVCLLLLVAGAAVGQDELGQVDRLLNEGKAKEARAAAEAAVQRLADNSMAWFLLARACHADGDLHAAIVAGKRAVEFPGVRASSYYNLACAYALTGRPDEAFAALHLAKRAGFANRDLMSTDSDLDSIRGDERFVLPGKRRYDVLDVGDTRGLPYSIDLPPGFDPKGSYPILVGPGEAEPQVEFQPSLYWGEDACQRGWIIIETPALLEPDPVEKMRRLLDHITATYKPEGGKFHLAGFSANSPSVFLVAMAMPERFHSVTGLPGLPPTEKDEELSRLKGVIVSFIVGGADDYWYGESRLAHARLERLGVETYFEVIPLAGHVLEDLFGGEFMERMQALRK